MFVSKDILEKLAIDLVQRIRLYINHQIYTYFVQRRSFLSSCYHLNLKQAFKVKNLVPMTMHHARSHWSRALYQVASALAHAKRPLFPKLTWFFFVYFTQRKCHETLLHGEVRAETAAWGTTEVVKQRELPTHVMYLFFSVTDKTCWLFIGIIFKFLVLEIFLCSGVFRGVLRVFWGCSRLF